MDKTCSHNKTWDEPCTQCDKASFEEISLPMLKRNCQHAARFYTENPGLVSPQHTADLYSVISKLVSIIEHQAPAPKGDGGREKNDVLKAARNWFRSRRPSNWYHTDKLGDRNAGMLLNFTADYELMDAVEKLIKSELDGGR